MRSFISCVFVMIFAAMFHSQAMAMDIDSTEGMMRGCALYEAGIDNHSWDKFDVDTTRQAFMCLGALKATEQLMELHKEFCPPSGVLIRDALIVVNQYVKAHPGPDGHFKFLHPWPGQTPPLDSIEIA